jgi:hypothetical protein
MDTSDIVATGAAIISLGSLLFSWLVYRQTQHAEMLRALQGEKEAVGYMAFSLSEGRLPRSPRRRREILKSLCLAAVFEGSDRSRVLVYEALRRHARHDDDEVKEIVDSIESRFADMSELADLNRGQRRLAALKAALAKAR